MNVFRRISRRRSRSVASRFSTLARFSIAKVLKTCSVESLQVVLESTLPAQHMVVSLSSHLFLFSQQSALTIATFAMAAQVPKKDPPTLQTFEAKKLLHYAKRSELEQAIGPQGMEELGSRHGRNAAS